MGIFSRKKAAVERDDEDESQVGRLEAGVKDPFKARVCRLDPIEYHGVRVGGDIQADQFYGLHSMSELREQVAKVAGGGKFEAKIYEDRVSGIPITNTRFVLAGEPKLAGKAIDPPEAKKKPHDEDEVPDEVAKLERQEEIEEIRHRAELARRRRDQELAASAPSSDGESSSSSSTELLMQKLAEMEAAREKSQQEFELKLEQQRREFEQRILEQQREAERREDRAQQDRKLEAVQAQVMQLMTQIAAGKNDTSMTDLMKMMKQSSDENLKLLVSILSKSSDEKLNLAQMSTETLTKTFQAGINAGSGKIDEETEEQPKDLAGVVNAQVGKVIDLVGQYVMSRPDKKTPMSEAEVAQMSQAIAAKIRSEQSSVHERQLARTRPATPAQAPVPAGAPQQADAKTPVDPGKQMNMLLRKIIRDARAGRATDESFISDAQKSLSPEVFNELVTAFQGGGVENVIAVMRKYGDSRLVDEAYRATTEASAPAAEESQPTVSGQPNAPVTAAQAPTEE